MVHRFVKLIFFYTFKQARNKVSKLKVPWKVLKRTEFDFSLLPDEFLQNFDVSGSKHEGFWIQTTWDWEGPVKK